MNIVHENREYIIQTQNTAQSELEGYLEKLGKHTAELYIPQSLSGNIDFSVLEKFNMSYIKKIVFQTGGKITSIKNLPTRLEVLECANQLLIDINDAPATLTHLNISTNFLTTIDLTKFKKLLVLNVSENNINKIENIPESIKELHCSHNEIKHLDLRGLSNLRILNISNNKTIVIENLPLTLVDFNSTNTPYIEVNSGGEQIKKKNGVKSAEGYIDYIEGLNDYFKLKRAYEDKITADRKKAYSIAGTRAVKRRNVALVIPKCINCRQPGGTIFNKKSNTYYAKCNHKEKPCNLDIQIYTGKYDNIESTMNTEYNYLDELNTSIICKKMDTIFGYSSTTNAASTFNKYLDDYTYYKNDYTELLEKYNDLYKNTIREQLIRKKQGDIYELIMAVKALIEEYKTTGKKELLKNAITIQVNDLNPEMHNLRMLRHKVMEMDIVTVNNAQSGFAKEGDDSEENIAQLVSTLVQRYSSLQSMENLIGNGPSVIKYNK
jgi:hypothetical protein